MQDSCMQKNVQATLRLAETNNSQLTRQAVFSGVSVGSFPEQRLVIDQISSSLSSQTAFTSIYCRLQLIIKVPPNHLRNTRSTFFSVLYNQFPQFVIAFSLFCFQGQKGERGSPAKKPDGVIQFSDTTNKCIPRIAGTVRYSASQKALLLCDGSAWLPLLAAGKGYVASKPGRHCLDILNSGQFLI